MTKIATAGAPFTLGAGYGPKLRWIEHPAGFGLRFVGYADELNRSIRHTGWFLEDDADWSGETARGAVYRVASKHGKPRFFAGLYTSTDTEGATVALEMETIDDESEAALRADRLAEMYAETERDYHRAGNAGFQFAELGEAIAGYRATARSLIREMKAARKRTLTGWPAICGALRARLAELRHDSHKAWEERAELQRDYGSEDAFAEAVRDHG